MNVLSKRSTLFRAVFDVFKASLLYFVFMLILLISWELGPWSSGGEQLFFLPTTTIVYFAAAAVSKVTERTFFLRTEITLLAFWLLILFALNETASNLGAERTGLAKQLIDLLLYTLPVPILCARFTLK
ncbi:MAG: hypothetical protein ACT4N9_07750 [Paracoccaceae bacterium]